MPRKAPKCSCKACAYRPEKSEIDCKFDSDCTRRDCKFAHANCPHNIVEFNPRPCQFGINCNKCPCKPGLDCTSAHPSPALKCLGVAGEMVTGFSSLSLRSPPPAYGSVVSINHGGSAVSASGSRSPQAIGVIFDLGKNFQRMYNVETAFMNNLGSMLSDHSKKLVILLVDMDQVPKFYQKASVDAIARMPVPVFVVGSANRQVDRSAMASKGNFHFTLAQKTKDSADAIIAMMAASLQSLLVACRREDDVYFATISDDRIFEQVTSTLRQGGAFAQSFSKKDAAHGLENFSRMLGTSNGAAGGSGGAGRQQKIRQPEPDSDSSWASDSDSDSGPPTCDDCGKIFCDERALEQHQDATGHYNC